MRQLASMITKNMLWLPNRAPYRNLKKKEKRKNEGLELVVVLGGSILLRFLGYLAKVCLDCYVLSSHRDRRAPRAHKELRWQRVERVGHTI